MNFAKIIAIEQKIECPHCKGICYFTDTSLDDLSKMDVEGIICCHCGGKSCTMPDSYISVMNKIGNGKEDEDDLHLANTTAESAIHTVVN